MRQEILSICPSARTNNITVTTQMQKVLSILCIVEMDAAELSIQIANRRKCSVFCKKIEISHESPVRVKAFLFKTLFLILCLVLFSNNARSFDQCAGGPLNSDVAYAVCASVCSYDGYGWSGNWTCNPSDPSVQQCNGCVCGCSSALTHQLKHRSSMKKIKR